MTLEKLARILAIVLGPHVWLPLLFIIIIFNIGLTSQQIKITFPIILLLQVVIPVSYLVMAPKLGWVDEWEMKNIKQRLPFLALMLVSGALTLIIVYFFGNKLLLQINIISICLLVILSTITVFWKISLHASLNTAASLLINYLFNWRYPGLFLVIPIIYWARLKLKRHTNGQLIAGILITSFIIFGGLLVFNE